MNTDRQIAGNTSSYKGIDETMLNTELAGKTCYGIYTAVHKLMHDS